MRNCVGHNALGEVTVRASWSAHFGSRVLDRALYGIEKTEFKSGTGNLGLDQIARDLI
jgi:hypothetical protein